MTNQKFWDSDNQRSRAWALADRLGVDYNDSEVQVLLRKMLRERDNAKQKPLTRSQYDDLKTGKTVKETKGEHVQTRRARGTMLDPNELPPPTGFVSDKSDVDWINYYLSDTLLSGHTLYQIQEVMSEFLNENPRAKFEVFRSAGKTVLVLAMIIRRICDNPEERFFFQSVNQTKTKQRIRVIRRELMTNPRIIEDYGYLPADNDPQSRYTGKWSETQLELKRNYNGVEPTIQGIAWGDDNALGQHFTGGVLDDPWTRKNQRTNGDFDKFWDWWNEFVGCLDQAKFVWVLCTKKGVDDIYHEWDTNNVFATFKQPLVEVMPEEHVDYEYVIENGAIVGVDFFNKRDDVTYVPYECNGKYTIENVLVLKKTITKRDDFEREYQLNPIPPKAKVFKWKYVNWAEPSASDFYGSIPFEDMKRGYHDMFYVAAYDPAFGTTRDADYQALVVMGAIHGRYYLLDLWIGKWDKQERIDVFNQYLTKYSWIPVYIEGYFRQMQMIKDLTGELKNKGLRFREVDFELASDAKYKRMYENKGLKRAGKLARIHDIIGSKWFDGNVYVNRVLEGTEKFVEFRNEAVTFPRCRKIDALDAFATGIYVLSKRGASDGPITISSETVSRCPIPEGQMGNRFTLGKW